MTGFKSTTRLSTIFTIIFLFSSLLIIHGQAAINPKRTVTVTNDLGQGISSTAHCQSKDDDFGVKVLNFHDSFHWTFRSSLFGGYTLYWCRVNWKNATGAPITAAFNAFYAKLDDVWCTDKCGISLRQDAVYYFNQVRNRWVFRSLWSH